MKRVTRIGSMLLAASMMAGIPSVGGVFAAAVEPEMVERTEAVTETVQPAEAAEQLGAAQQIEIVQTVTAFAQAGEQIGTISFSLGQAESELTAQMPQYLTVTLVDGTQVQAPVTWTCLGDYAQTDDFYYEFIPQLDDTYVLAEGIDPLTQAPYIMAERGDTVQQEDTMRGDAVQQEDAMTASSELAASSNMNTIYSFLTQKCGFNTAAACGILANIECESSFNPNLYGDNGTSYGICQWHNGRLTAM